MEMTPETKMETKTHTVYIREVKRGEAFPRRLRRVRRAYEVDTREVIEKAIRNLEELAEEAHKRATSKYLPTEVRQKWARIEAYIYQTINSLAKNYDSQRVLDKLEELTLRVEKYMEEDQQPREED